MSPTQASQRLYLITASEERTVQLLSPLREDFPLLLEWDRACMPDNKVGFQTRWAGDSVPFRTEVESEEEGEEQTSEESFEINRGGHRVQTKPEKEGKQGLYWISQLQIGS